MRVDGKVAIVTGAGGGIGAAIAAALVDRGVRVVLTDIDDAALSTVTTDLEQRADDRRVAAVAGDATSATHIDTTVELAESRFGPVDLYFANAGVMGAAGLDAPDDAWDSALGINVMAHVRAARRLVPGWVERGGGYFVATASAAGLLTQIGSATYSVSKHAAVGFAEWLDVTYGDKGVRVSCLCPMGVETKLLHPDQAPDDASRLAQRAVEAAGRLLTPADVAAEVMDALADERFLILPHPEVLEMHRHKGADYDRWLRGMRRFQRSLEAEDA